MSIPQVGSVEVDTFTAESGKIITGWVWKHREDKPSRHISWPDNTVTGKWHSEGNVPIQGY